MKSRPSWRRSTNRCGASQGGRTHHPAPSITAVIADQPGTPLPLVHSRHMPIQPQDAIQAAEGLRGDPLFYFVVVGMVGIIAIMGGVIAYLFKRNSDLQTSLMDLSKTGTEAIAAMMPILQSMREDQRESLRRFETQVERAVNDIKGHINVLRQLNP